MSLRLLLYDCSLLINVLCTKTWWHWLYFFCLMQQYSREADALTPIYGGFPLTSLRILAGQFVIFNPFVPNDPFWTTKQQKTVKVFWRFQGVEKECIGNEYVNSNYVFVSLILIFICSRFCFSSSSFLASKWATY